MDQDPLSDKDRWLAGQKKRVGMANAMFGALLVICFAGTMEILGAGVSDRPLMIALFLFSVGLPLNSLMVYACLHEIIFIKMADSKKYGKLLLVNAIIPTLGLVCIFWHFSGYLALSFFLSIVFSFYMLQQWTKKYIKHE